MRHAGVTPTSSSSSPALPLWLTAKGQSAARRPWPRRRGAPLDSPRIPAVHVPLAVPPYLKPPPSPRRAPNPSRPRGNSPDQPRRAAGGEGRGGKEEERSRPRESRPPRRPEPPEGGAGPARNDYIPYFLFFPDDAPPPVSSSSSPASRTATLHRRATLQPGAKEVRTIAASLLWTPRPSSRSERTAPPLVMPAIEPGRDELSCRCRCLHQRAHADSLAWLSSVVVSAVRCLSSSPRRRAEPDAFAFVLELARRQSNARIAAHPSARVSIPGRPGRALTLPLA
jgi:hypothetical protein